MTSAAITHFDGDPVTLNYWLYLYDKYWRDEVDKVYLVLSYNPEISVPEIIAFNKKVISQYSNIILIETTIPTIPEIGNKMAVEQAKEDLLFFIESDGLIFGKGLVKEHLDMIREDKCDIVGGDYTLLPEPLATDLNFRGLMRNFLFCKREDFMRTDLYFLPYMYGDIPLDCFGWISLQLRQQNPRINYVPHNCLHPSREMDMGLYQKYKWLHIRQMSSSTLGIGTDKGGFIDWMNRDPYSVGTIRGTVLRGNHAEWTYMKAVAFKSLMLERMDNSILGFIPMYRDTLDFVISALDLNITHINKVMNFYRNLL